MSAIKIFDAHKEFSNSVRNTLTELLVSVSRTNLSDSSTAALRETVKALEDQFLVVVVGEYNSGKSSFINALLDTDILPTGVTPTTNLIHLIRHGESVTSTPIETWGNLVTHPSPFLESISLVDTPGTNSIFANHSVLTNWFYPRADLVIFVTSADRPYTESESLFLRAVQQWGKKIVIILNKTDQVNNAEDLRKIREFVAENTSRELNSNLPIFEVSSKQKIKSNHTHDKALASKSGFDALETFLQEKLDDEARFQMKMDASLSLGEKTVSEALVLLKQEMDLYTEDLRLTKTIQDQSDAYQVELKKEIDRSLNEIHAVFEEIKAHGNEYFEELFKVKNIPNILKKEKNQLEFQDRVLQNLPTAIERKTTEMVESIYFQEQRMTQFATMQIEKRKTAFPGNAISSETQNQRADLLQKMQRSIDDMVEKIQNDMAEEIGLKHVQKAVTTALAIEVSAVGIGAGLTIIATTLATDILGVVAAFWIGIAGFLVLPYYRKKSQTEFEKQITDVEKRLISSLRLELNHEIQAQGDQLTKAILPFRSYVKNTVRRIEKQHLDLSELRGRISTLRQKLGTSSF
jgi:small GTP-binding protein